MEFGRRRHCLKDTLPFKQALFRSLRTIAAVTVIVLLFYWDGLGQTIVQGKVTDAATSTPVPFANVYFGNTTIGVVSNTDGEFRFEMRMKGSFELIISFVGYAKIKIPVIIAADSVFSFDIKLKQEAVALNALIVHGDTTPTHPRDLREFMRVLVGTTKNASDCSLKNPGDVFARKDKSGRSLTAYARAPIIIENRALGYELHYDLEHFYTSEQGTRYSGTTFFKELTPTDEKEKQRWELNREKSYRGSVVHLIRSVLGDCLPAEGWEVKILYRRFRPSEKYIMDQIKKFRELGIKDSVDYYKEMRLMPSNERMRSKPLRGHEIMDSTNHQLMTFRGQLIVLYKNEGDPRNIGRRGPSAFAQASELEFETQPHVLYDNGSYSPQKDVLVNGYFAFGERVAEWVPYEYKPSTK